MKKMLQKSAVMRGTDNMVIKEVPVPEVRDKEVLVSLEYVGICGSDVHYYHNGNCGAYKVDLSQDFMLGQLPVVNANSVNPVITISARMLSSLQHLLFRVATKSLSLSLKICALNFLTMYPLKKVH